jgi:hypothetical protein
MDEVAKRCLDKYCSLQADNERRKQDGLHDYSLIASMLKPSNEVTLHSRFLCSMLNPKGLHYQGNIFLKLFLEKLPVGLRDFIDLKRAMVLREKDSIDILIHDGEHALIIENKINALDQPHQISRYIGCVQKRLFAGEQNLAGRLAVIYLSARRRRPSSNSMIGFSLVDDMLRWEGVGQPNPHPDLPELQLGSEIPFHHYPYFPSLTQWAECCAEKAPAGGIRNAFEEYRLVLERLQKPKSWRKVMSLDSYAMSLSDADQREMYAFMVEAQPALDRFIVAKLFTGLTELFGEDVIALRGPFKRLDEDSLHDWLLKKGKDWEKIGFKLDVPGRGQFGFVMANVFIYMGYLSEKPLWNKEHADSNRLEGGNVRELLRTQPDGIYRLLSNISRRAAHYGAEAAAPNTEV